MKTPAGRHIAPGCGEVLLLLLRVANKAVALSAFISEHIRECK